MKTIKQKQSKDVLLNKRTKDTSQQFAVFFHKFGLVRFSFNPGAEVPGFSFQASIFL